jgi:hypothetical protein
MMSDPTPVARPSVRKRLAMAIVWIVFCLVLFETTAQLYAYLVLGFPAGPSDRREASMFRFYPELESIREEIGGDESFDILLLGGSVLWEWGEFYGPSQVGGRTVDSRPVRLHVAARPAHTSLDSLHKAEILGSDGIDLYVFYQSINEVRTNNIPPEHWRDDYSHYSWYDDLRFYSESSRAIDLGFRSPILLFKLGQLGRSLSRQRVFIPTDWPAQEFLRYGSDVRSSKSLERNVRAILDLAVREDVPVVLSSFAWYKPEDYDIENYRREVPAPDEGIYKDFYVLPIELWGEPEQVVQALRAHNRVLESLGHHEAVLEFVPMDRSIPQSEELFDDICHLTEVGYRLFGEKLLATVFD